MRASTRQPAWSGLEEGENVKERAAHRASWTGSVNGSQSRYSTGQRYDTSTNLEKKHGRQKKLCDERMIYAAQIRRTYGLLANERVGCFWLLGLCCEGYVLPVYRARGGGLFSSLM